MSTCSVNAFVLLLLGVVILSTTSPVLATFKPLTPIASYSPPPSQITTTTTTDLRSPPPSLSTVDDVVAPT
ncbi:hypothetical protein AAZX31_17G053900 [Glycine max]|nr:hypothetical protein GLYMA_17G055451v4 [Glycine max]